MRPSRRARGPEPRNPVRWVGDEGSSTPAVLGVVLVCLVLLTTVAALGHVALMNHRAAKAADLSALAGADAARGLRPGDPCTVAGEVARSNGARLLHCALAPDHVDVVDVRVVVDLNPILAGLGPAEGRSRAGPPPQEQGLVEDQGD